MAFRKPKKSKALQESWEALLKKYGEPTQGRKLTTRSSKNQLVMAPTLMKVLPQSRLPQSYPSVSTTHSARSAPPQRVCDADPYAVLTEEEYGRREAEARKVKHCIMPGHKQGYELVTDPEMIKQMGKKTA